MNKNEPVRVTKPTLKVAAYLSDLKGASTWGLQICAETGLGSGSVYSVLDRFEGYGWVESYWEEDNSRRGARRRLYKVTTLGKGSLKELVADHAPASSPIRNLKKVQA
ncbi:MAG: PadR family transcriptional regulator [Micrococcales bacterium]|nr:PadR family transcriptional regulator [Micrococcales bacterium]